VEHVNNPQSIGYILLADVFTMTRSIILSQDLLVNYGILSLLCVVCLVSHCSLFICKQNVKEFLHMLHCV
jgi:hypothetical protein